MIERLTNLSRKMGICLMACLMAQTASIAANADQIQNQISSLQKTTITGRIVDYELNEGLPGVNIVEKGTANGTISDIDGRYSLAVSADAILVFSSVGFISEEIPLNSKTVIDLVMMPDVKQLEEIVVVGYGEQKKVSSVAAISQIKGEELEKIGGVTNVSQALQGMMPGVIAMSSTSKPGADAAQILIRGKASWVSSNPLTLVDGVERDINDVNMNEIESISVLKDASATAVYGVKGANGVILITTKRGSVRAPEINFKANFGFIEPTAGPEYADYITAMEMWNVAATNDQQWNKLIPQSTIGAWRNAYETGNYGPYNAYFPHIDWWDEMVETGTQQKYTIDISGGTEFMKYFASLGYLNDGDIFKTEKNEIFDPAFYYKRYNWRSNFDFNLTKTTTLGVNLSGFKGYRNQNGYRINDGGEDGWGQPEFFQTLYTSARNVFPISWPDGSYGVNSGGGGNLIASFDKGQRVYEYYKNFIDITLDQKLDAIVKGLKVSGKFGFNAESNTTSAIRRYANNWLDPISWYRAYDYSNPLDDGSFPLLSEKRWPDDYFQGTNPVANYDNMLVGGYRKRLYYEAALNYKRDFGDHSVTALGLVNRYENEGLEGGSATKLKFKERDEAWVSRITYNWKERYLVELNGAYTGSQKFAPGKRFKFFPSYSVGWRLSEEKFVKEAVGSFLDNFKVRYSYGMVGYDRIPGIEYAYIQMYENAGGGVSFGDYTKNNYGPLFREGAAANPNATWETAYKQNLGFEVDLFNKLSINADLFKEDREGILMPVATPGWFGIAAPQGNIGQTKNRGAEIELGWNDKIGQNFRYWVKGNVAVNENRVTFRNDPVFRADYQKYAGKPIGVQNKFLVNGYYASLDDIFNYATANNVATQNKLLPGDFIYVDYNVDGVIDNNDQVPVKDLTYPMNTYSLALGFSYKNLDVMARFYGVANTSTEIDQLLLWDLQHGNEGNYYARPDVTAAWTYENAGHAVKPVLHSDHRDYSMRGGTTYSFRDASYIRLKNVDVTYTIDQSWLKNFNIGQLQVFANGDNLLTFTKLAKDMDPETGGAGVYPLVRRYNVGFKLSF